MKIVLAGLTVAGAVAAATFAPMPMAAADPPGGCAGDANSMTLQQIQACGGPAGIAQRRFGQQQPVQEQTPFPAQGDDNGGRCDWAKGVGWSQYAQCTVHVGPQTQQDYQQQQESLRCHQLYGADPNHSICPQ